MIADQQAALGAGETTAVELARAVLARIAARDPELRAIAAVDEHRTLREASAADTRRAGGERGPLLGVPITVKDAFVTVAPPSAFGSRSGTLGVDGTHDATAVRALSAAGAVIVAKTACGERCIGDYVLRGMPENPAAPGHIVGASSGGCAAAIAAGMIGASIGTDTGGSVRSPAAYCGVVGLKPTAGSMPLEGAVPLAPTLDHGGILGRTVDDVAAVWSVFAAANDATGTAVGPGAPGTSAERLSPAPTRVLVVDPASARDADVARALRAALVATWNDADVSTVSADVFDGWRAIFEVLMPGESARANAAAIADPALGAAARTVYELGQAVSDASLDEARVARAAFAARLDALLAPGTVLITPAVDGPAPRTPHARASEGFWSEMDWLAPLNLSGHPAIVVPVPAAGPPVGLQIVAPSGAEPLAIATAARVVAIASANPGLETSPTGRIG